MSEKKYREFHGHPSRYEKKFDFHNPKRLIVLGQAHAIEYCCDKSHGCGDGKMTIWRHVFETPASVCMDETGKKQLYIVGNKLEVTEAGVEN